MRHDIVNDTSSAPSVPHPPSTESDTFMSSLASVVRDIYNDTSGYPHEQRQPQYSGRNGQRIAPGMLLLAVLAVVVVGFMIVYLIQRIRDYIDKRANQPDFTKLGDSSVALPGDPSSDDEDAPDVEMSAMSSDVEPMLIRVSTPGDFVITTDSDDECAVEYNESDVGLLSDTDRDDAHTTPPPTEQSQ